MELEQYGLAEAGLIDGERIESALSLGEESDENKGVVLLTDRRVIHIPAAKRNRTIAFIPIQNIDVVELGMEREGFGAYIWAGLAFVVAIMLWRVLQDNTALGSIAAAVLVALMGVYLIVDRLMSSGNPVAIFKTRSSEIRCDLIGDEIPPEIYGFINRLFELKHENGTNGTTRPNRFSPR